MRLREDFRIGRLVIVGAWNPIILDQVPWLAKHVLGYDEGSEIDVSILLENETGKRVALFPNVGISLVENRVEFYETPNGTLSDILMAAEKLLKALPHTPVSAFGVNFKFEVEQVADLETFFETSDGLDSLGQILSRRYETTIVESETRSLNVVRHWSEKQAVLQINFHHQIGINKIPDVLKEDVIYEYRFRAESIVTSRYGGTVEGKIDFLQEGE